MRLSMIEIVFRFCILPSYLLLTLTLSVNSLLYLGVKAQQYFLTSNCMFFDKKTLLKMLASSWDKHGHLLRNRAWTSNKGRKTYVIITTIIFITVIVIMNIIILLFRSKDDNF